MKEALVKIQSVSKKFDKHSPSALDNINAIIPKGEIVGLVGPDGAGKTTLIRLIAGLMLPATGNISVAGFDTIKEADSIHKFIGYMPQKFGLYEDLSVIQNLNLHADLRGVNPQEKEEKFKHLLNFTGLALFKERLAGALSGGMKQKLGLACTLLQKPILLLLDEPSVGVDPISRRELWKMVKELWQEGMTVLWSTSYLDEAEKCNHVLLLDEGKVLYHGSPTDLTLQMKGRVFELCRITNNRRTVLKKVLSHTDIVDAVIWGENIRVVLRKGTIPTIDSFEAGKDAFLEPSEPRFEDAFIDILGGGPGGHSVLSDTMKSIEEPKFPVVKTKHLVKKFGMFIAADDISFEIKPGEVFGLLGPNGAGKSTTFKMLCGLLKPTSGEAYVTGLNLQKAPAKARARIGYMAQKFSLYGNLSVMQNLLFFSGIYNLSGKTRKKMIDQMIEIFNLEAYLNTNAEMLSLGYKQRLALSCSLMHNPEVLFLDEPTSGVDPITRREFWNHINGIVEKGVTVLVTTHFMDEAEYCDRIGLIYRSKMIKIDTPLALKVSVRDKSKPMPTLEDAFIELIKRYDKANHNGS
jgi:ABC-2 type transport system ATP-binding protein